MAKKVKVKCRSCGKQIDKNDAVGVKHGKSTWFYCANHVGQPSTKDKFYMLAFNIIGSTTHTLFFKEMAEIEKVHTFPKMISYLEDNREYLENVMNKEFYNEVGKIRYFSAILKNNLGDYTPKQAVPAVKKEVAVEIYEPKKTPRKQERKGLDSLLDDLLD